MTSIPTVARRLHELGYTPWGVRHDGTKAPTAGRPWRDVDDQPTWDEIADMFADAQTGLGILTGRASGGIELLEFEGRAVAEGTYDEFCDRLIDAGMDEIWEQITSGYSAVSGGGGYHFMFRVDGDCLPNTKLAQRPATPEELDAKPTERTKTLIETRGQGGFVIVPPSNGKVHPHGGAWKLTNGSFSKIVTITTAQRDALYAIAESFDEVASLATTYHQLPGERAGSAAELQDWVAERIGVAALLEENDWTPERPRRDGQQYWTRPGKDPREGHSGSLFPDGGFMVWTSTLDEAWNQTLLAYESGWRGCTPVGVLAAVRFDGDVTAAMSWVRKQITAESKPEYAPSTGLNLSDDFWDRRPFLAACRDAAHAGLASPDAVLASALPRLAAMVPPAMKLPAIIGGQATLDYMTCVVASSSGGKTISNGIAERLLPIRDDGVILADQTPGSGEGLIQAFIDFERDEKGKKVGDPSYKHSKVRAVHLTADEGSGLHEQAGRSGTTIMQTLCSAWSGSQMGQLNASQETKRFVPKGKRRVSATLNIQTRTAHTLFDWSVVGLPQRLLYAWAHSDMPDEDCEMPEAWILTSVPMQDMPDEFVVDDAIRAEIRAYRRQQGSGQVIEHELDGHRNLLRLKTAALLAFAESRRNVSVEDWELAGEIVATSCRVRDHIATVAHAEERQRAEAIGRRQGLIEGTKADFLEVEELKKIDALATRIGAVVAEKGGLGKSKLRSAVCSATTIRRFDPALEAAIERGLVVVEEGARGGERISPA